MADTKRNAGLLGINVIGFRFRGINARDICLSTERDPHLADLIDEDGLRCYADMVVKIVAILSRKGM